MVFICDMKKLINSVLYSPSRIKLISNFLSLSFIQGANYLIPLLILPYIVRVIGPEKFGLLSYSQSFIYYFTIIINYSFDYTATRDISLNREDAEKVSIIYSSVFFSKLILFIISTIIFAITILSIDKFNQNLQLYCLTYLINIGFVFFPSWFFQGIEKLTKTSVFNFLTKIIFASVIIFFISKKEDYLYYAFGTSIAQITTGIIAFLYAIRNYKIKISIIPWSDLFQTFKQGFPVFFSNVAASLYATTNLIILGFFISEKEYGYFSAALKIASVIYMLIILPLSMTLFPHIGKAMQNSNHEGIQIIKKYLKYVAVITLFLAFIVFVFAEQLIVLLFGNEFIAGAFYLKILAFMPFFSGINNLISIQGLLNLKKDRIFLIFTLATLLLSIILNFILVPLFHAVGTAIILLLVEIFMATLSAFYVFKRIELQ